MQNFIKRVLIAIEQQQTVYLYGHTSSITPEDEDSSTYNQELSQRRSDMFKNAVIDSIESFIDKYALCNAIIEDELKTLSEDDKINFILKYEEINDNTIRIQRTQELKVPTSDGSDTIRDLFKSYRVSELLKTTESALKNIIVSKGLTPPNLANEKVRYMSLANNFIVAEGKGDTERLILNETDNDNAILRNDIAKLPQYKSFVNITDPEIKQSINIRVTYKFPESQDKSMGGGSKPESNNQSNSDGYGKNGINGEEGFSLDSMFDGMEENDGQFMDQHLDDDVSPELREQMVKDLHEKLKSRGFVKGDIESTLERLQKQKKDYLKEIKRGITMIKGQMKESTITRPNRRNIKGLKGKKKYGAKINCILDTSGSMSGYFEKALSFIFRNDIQVNLIQVDTEVHCTDKITNKNQLEKVVIKGMGGTIIQPGVDYVAEKFNQFNTLILTDGYTDTLNFENVKGKVLIISNSQECPTINDTRVKQIIVKDDD
jgi:hypothetical protein